ncbi:MAG TPA: nuclear transport factor 2 family protein [Xanthobacteraceae bacterium]|nr:nuclear transport factor 2 family protein [Xanthobacteraceae bacterium]
MALLLWWPAHAFAGPAEDASAVIDRWAAAVGAGNADAAVKLYTPDASVYGVESAKLVQGSDAIREYFKSAPESGHAIKIAERRMAAVSDAAVVGAGVYRFDLVQNADAAIGALHLRHRQVRGRLADRPPAFIAAAAGAVSIKKVSVAWRSSSLD